MIGSSSYLDGLFLLAEGGGTADHSCAAKFTYVGQNHVIANQAQLNWYKSRTALQFMGPENVNLHFQSIGCSSSRLLSPTGQAPTLPVGLTITTQFGIQCAIAALQVFYGASKIECQMQDTVLIAFSINLVVFPLCWLGTAQFTSLQNPEPPRTHSHPPYPLP